MITKTGRPPAGPGHIAQKSRPIFKDDFLRNVIVSIYFLVFRQKPCVFVFLIRVNHTEYTRFRKYDPEKEGPFERRGFWTRTYVQFMLQNEIYVGSMVQGRQYTPSHRSKKREPVPKADWTVVPNMHEPIVSRELFDEAQKKMRAREKIIKANDEPHLFAGLFYREACGTAMRPGVSQHKYQDAIMRLGR